MHPILDALGNKAHVIWDWNGTLLDDVQLCVGVISELLLEQGKAPLSVEEYRNKFGFPVVDYYVRLGFDFDRVPFEKVATEFVKRYNERVHSCQLFEGVQDVLENLRGAGLDQSILSAAKETDLHFLTDTHGIAEFFAHRFGIADHYAAGKVARGQELIAELGGDKGSIVLIGDTDHDAEVAKALGIDALLLTGGHHPIARLQATGSPVLSFRL
ncbi:MAG: HAD family hydrolase [Bdellovibrionaceae bacterium]|nr:HAD family hydrolase [Bdellovibrionales bacterium]MCB9254264.1 HAD family hydrolase [Pseudobdellovibrionaceae bacterium]